MGGVKVVMAVGLVDGREQARWDGGEDGMWAAECEMECGCTLGWGEGG